MIKFKMSKTQLLLSLALILLMASAKAQYVSLNPGEIGKLSALIKTNTTVKNTYTSLETVANAALEQSPMPVDTIISEGHLANDPKKIKTLKALADMVNALTI
jgi:predicted transcriptional regulator